MLCKLILGTAGLSFGLLVASGVFTVLVAVGLVPRFASKTETARYVKRYEDAIIIGTICGTLVDMFVETPKKGLQSSLFLPAYGLIIIGGLFSGIFIGCFAMAIAELLDSIPIFARRIRFSKGLTTVTWGIAIGKMVGSFLYFALNLYNYGGQ